MERTRPRGLYFEEFAVDQELQGPARTITEADVVQFAGLSGDYNQLHTDAVYAARHSGYGKRIAHGLLGLSVASGLAARAGFIEGTALAFLGLDWRFKKPIFIGDTIAITARVRRVRPMASSGGGIVVLDVSVTNQSGAIVQQGEWSLLMRGRPQAAE
ncbi:MAG: dehydratase [Chloroflexi bacterium]|nr:dehydratase [Chloroflexota bacterium]